MTAVVWMIERIRDYLSSEKEVVGDTLPKPHCRLPSRTQPPERREMAVLAGAFLSASRLAVDFK